MNFDYFYNRQSEMYNFIRLPMVLMEDKIFESISIEAKVLYSYMLNRMGLSYKNGWIDEDGKVFIYYTIESIKDQFNCASEKANKLIAELDIKSGIGLIEKKRQGLGKHNRIYVKDFMSIIAVKENDFQKSKNLTSEVKDFNLRSKENELQEVKNVDSNYIENNKSKYSKREYSFCENGLGTFQNVFLKDEDIGELQIIMAGELDNYIERLSTYLQSTGKTYKDHKATILSWFYKDQGKSKQAKTSNIPTWEEYNKGEHL